MQTLRVGFLHDVFRSPSLDQWDAAPQAQWLQEFITPALEFIGATVRPVFDKANSGIPLWLAEQLNAGTLDPGTSGWCDLYSASHHREGLASIFRPMLEFDLIVGYELSPNQIRFLDKNEKPFIDLRIDALRFCADALFSARTNHPGLALALSQFHAPDDDFLSEAGLLRAELNRSSENANLPATDLLFIGQVDVDTSLIADSRIAHIGSFLPDLDALMQTHDRMVLYPHPLGIENADVAELLLAFPQAVVGRGSVYAAVCSHKTRTVTTLSSSVAEEARLLGKHAICLLRPDISPEALGAKLCCGTFRIDQVLGTRSFWECVVRTIRGQFLQGILARRPMPRLSGELIRSALGIYRADPRKQEPNRLVGIDEIIELASPTNVASHCLFGWSYAETLGVWSVGTVSVLTFDVGHTPSAVELSLCAFIGMPGRNLSLEICIGGSDGAPGPLLKRDFSDDGQCTLVVPLSQTAPRRRYDLRFQIHTPASPRSLDISEDTRRLGIRLTWFRLVPVSSAVEHDCCV